MSNENRLPTTLLEATRYFADLDTATAFVASFRWPDGPECPSCGNKELGYTKTRRLWQCKDKACKRQFTVKVGTIFEDSPIPLDKWLTSMWLIANAKNGISSHELGRSVGLTQKSAWFVNHRLRLAMQTGSYRKFSGEVEVDETFVGGLSKNMHKDVRKQKITGTGGMDKAIVLGFKQRGGDVRAMVVPARGRPELHPRIRSHVEEGSMLYTDKHHAYTGALEDDYGHEVVDHAVEYVNGQVHTNSLENFWSLLKRGLKGTYISVQPFHLFRYLDEQVYRFNRRKLTDFERFGLMLQTVSGRRLTYAELTGKD
jgi:transposase-like protein